MRAERLVGLANATACRLFISSVGHRSLVQDRWAIGGPLDSVARGLPRSGADTHISRSGRLTARSCQIPKLTVRASGPVLRPRKERCDASGG